MWTLGEVLLGYIWLPLKIITSKYIKLMNVLQVLGAIFQSSEF
jgi:hypothetical protein